MEEYRCKNCGRIFNDKTNTETLAFRHSYHHLLTSSNFSEDSDSAKSKIEKLLTRGMMDE